MLVSLLSTGYFLKSFLKSFHFIIALRAVLARVSMTAMLQRALSSLLLRGLVTNNHENFSRQKSLSWQHCKSVASAGRGEY